MKAMGFVVAFALGLLAISAVPGQAAEAKQDFDLVNKTGYEIKHVYV